TDLIWLDFSSIRASIDAQSLMMCCMKSFVAPTTSFSSKISASIMFNSISSIVGEKGSQRF
ncbi:TPA: hypothetical protein ACGJ1C_005049, partial [Pseudomonas aeruginosa]